VSSWDVGCCVEFPTENGLVESLATVHVRSWNLQPADISQLWNDQSVTCSQDRLRKGIVSSYVKQTVAPWYSEFNVDNTPVHMVARTFFSFEEDKVIASKVGWGPSMSKGARFLYLKH
jgi:hypothetical protein